MQPQAEKRPYVHCLKLRPQAVHHVRRDLCPVLDNARRLLDHVLAHIKDGQRDIEGVRQYHHSHEGLEGPLEEHPGIHIVEVVPVNEHLNELIGGDKGKDNPGNRQDNGFG